MFAWLNFMKETYLVILIFLIGSTSTPTSLEELKYDFKEIMLGSNM
jgi:hypothetical protein